MIKKMVKQFKERNLVYGYISREIVPVFHDGLKTTNKTFLEFNTFFSNKDSELKEIPFESQNGKLVKFYKGFMGDIYNPKNTGKHMGDVNFSMNGFKQGLSYRKSDIAFVDKGSLYEVVLVTDKYVYSKNLESGVISIYKHEEMLKFKESGWLKIC